MKRRAASSVFIAIFLTVLLYAAVFSMLMLMNQQEIQQAEPEPHLLIAYSLKTQYLNFTNLGPGEITVEGFAFFSGPDCYVLPYRASLNPGQGDFVYLYDALKANETVAVLTDEGAVEISVA